jgi:hypothetical protein
MAGHPRHRIEEQFERPTIADHSLGKGSVTVHVRVDETRHHRAIRGVNNARIRRSVHPGRTDREDPVAFNQDVGGSRLAPAQVNEAAIPDDGEMVRHRLGSPHH